MNNVSDVLPDIDPVLAKLHDTVTKHFGDRLERLVLYGSRARGDARPDSDYDVAIFVRDLGNRWRELKSLGPITLDLLIEYDAEVNLILYPAGHWRAPASPLMHELRRDGIDVYRCMKQETANLLAIALRDLNDARQVNQIGIHHQAARRAYYAMFHAAHTLIFERTNRMAKTHRGVAKVFHRLALDEPSLDRSVPASLSYAYSFKETADYETGSKSTLTRQEAIAAIDDAERFIEAIQGVFGNAVEP